ncbi:hypothetical protein K457DRAFT_688794 [Linnemannia elongata AG-77]|uniref:PA14 domain-containing protein n=1 Tax=Linnemannia elongata AG-77 TaxID=1314771 RepID=A0A197JN31_9FUNG|nr:hypothetical protein K457DRAFT_688794 [Linnemannia elongata AG-77]
MATDLQRPDSFQPSLATNDSISSSPSQEQQQQQQQHGRSLHHKPSAASISSLCSTSSNTTNQTFMSTLSFSTVTGRHSRTATQEEVMNLGESLTIETDYNDDDHAVFDHEDLDSLDLNILTPRKYDHLIDPFDEHPTLPSSSSSLSNKTPVAEDTSRLNSQGYHHHHSSQSSMASYKRHIKTESQLSSGVVTVKGMSASINGQHHSADSSASSPSSPSALSISSRRYSSSSSASRQQQGAEEMMMFASPDYRKSLAMSVQSDAVVDISGGHSARGSNLFLSDTPQYSNLLRDATWMIEQQHLQDSNAIPSHNRASHSSEDSQNASHSINRGSGDHVLSLSSTVSSRAGTRSTISPPSPSTTGATNAPVYSSVNKGNMTISRSRRFSAPGSQYSGHGSISSVSRSSALSSSTYEPPTPSTTSGQEILPFSGASGMRASQGEDLQQTNTLSPRQDMDSSSEEDDFQCQHSREADRRAKYTIQPLQHHPTMQPYLSSNNRSSIGTGVGIAGSSFSPSSTLANSTSPNQPQLQRDYRPGVVFEYYEGEWDWLPNFDEMRPDHVGIVGNFMIDDTTERDLFRPQVYTGPAGKKSNGFGADGQGLPEYQPRRPYKESGNFAVRFTTHMDITQDGVYSFWLSSNDGSVLYISNTLVVENDGMHYSTEAEGRILLQTGRHPMTVEFFHKNGKMLEGFRSTGPSLVVSYRAPGPVWSFGLKSGPKRIVKSSNLFYDHGDIRMRNLLSEYGTDDDSSMMMERGSGCLSPTESRRSYGGFGQDWRQVNGGHGQSYQQRQQQQQPYQQSQLGRPTRHRVMSGDMGQMQLSTRELQVQMENAKTTIKDLEQIIRDQTEDHQKKMRELYNILQDTQGQVDRLVSGIKKATLFEKPRTTIHPSHHSNPAWRNTVVSIYVDAEEDYPLQEGDTGGKKADDESHLEVKPEADEVLVKHLSDVEKLKQLYFFSMALSVKMNREMMGKATSEYTSTSVQKLYEDCAIHSRVPVEGWPGYVSRHFARQP